MTTQWKTFKLLLKNKDNLRWWIKNLLLRFFKFFTAFASVWGILGSFHIDFTDIIDKLRDGSSIVILILGTIICFIWAFCSSINELIEYSHLKVETERAGCTVEIRLADSYLTNAFDNYPNSAMIIGLNKAFWFQEAEPKSLVADMWGKLEKKGITKEQVQEKIDEALTGLWTVNGVEDKSLKASYIDQSRPKVYVRCNGSRNNLLSNCDGCTFDCALDPAKMECRDNYKIGTVVGVDLTWTEPEERTRQALLKLYAGALISEVKKIRYDISRRIDKRLGVESPEQEKLQSFQEYLKNNRIKVTPENVVTRKLYFLANSEVVHGHVVEEPMKVTFDRNAPVVEKTKNK